LKKGRNFQWAVGFQIGGTEGDREMLQGNAGTISKSQAISSPGRKNIFPGREAADREGGGVFPKKRDPDEK